MTDIAIRVENLSKRYRIGEKRESYRTLRDAVHDTITAPFRAVRSRLSGSATSLTPDDQLWALKDVSFEVKRGESVGVVGRNGAGKSTLLKVLSRITEPTSGFAEINGRVGSLLEVGTGFHQELTGRENIFLNGAIMGMKKEEINRKFDDIVDFAEVERFIDMPVKHYSSGMYLRLAFSVAAYLEPEILLVDEVLAVGDLAFQRKCLGKMEDVAAHGRTVIFVSHNLGIVKELCKSSIVFNKGLLEFRGPVVEGLAQYSRCLAEDAGDSSISSKGWHSVSINGLSEGVSISVRSGEPFFVESVLDLQDDFTGGKLFLIINDSVGDIVVHQRIDSSELDAQYLAAGRYRIRAELPALWLAPGVYTVYHKFLGQSTSNNEGRYSSERIILDVTGHVNGVGRATLAPPPRWTMTPELLVTEENLAALCEARN
jgi:lipopolysaccharide transport system ATP-binding protein